MEIADVAANNGDVAEDSEATKIVDVVDDDGFHILNISATFWECLAVHFKLFLPIVYTYNAPTATLTVTEKWFIWSHSSNVWRARRQLKKKERKNL